MRKLKKSQLSAFYLAFLIVVVIVTALVSVKLATNSVEDKLKTSGANTDNEATVNEDGTIEEPIFDLVTDNSPQIDDQDETPNRGENVNDFEETEGSEDDEELNNENDNNDNEDQNEADNEGESGDKFIRINSPAHNRVFRGVDEIVFTGEVSANVDRVVVNALVVSNEGKTFNAIYTIRDFDGEASEFQYTSKVEWKNLTVGTNHYHFKAFFEDGTSQSKSVTVYLEDDNAGQSNSES